MILANKNGWMTIVNILKETDKYYHLQNVDDPFSEGAKWKLSKSDNSRKLFDDVSEAEQWILSQQEEIK